MVEWSLLAFKHQHVKAGTLQHSHLEFYCGSVRINSGFVCIYLLLLSFLCVPVTALLAYIKGA